MQSHTVHAPWALRVGRMDFGTLPAAPHAWVSAGVHGHPAAASWVLAEWGQADGLCRWHLSTRELVFLQVQEKPGLRSFTCLMLPFYFYSSRVHTGCQVSVGRVRQVS